MIEVNNVGKQVVTAEGTLDILENINLSLINGETLAWGPRDTFVVPSWHYHHHIANSECVLFSYSDRPVQKVLGLWREDRGNR